MKSFPDETKMERSQDGTEPIRGGSIGLNRILGRFVTRSLGDHRPEYTAVFLSAYTIFRNVWATYGSVSKDELDRAFVTDINLFCEYYDIYLSHSKTVFGSDHKAPVIVYFPDYKRVEPELQRDVSGKNLDFQNAYKAFLRRYDGRDQMVRTLDHVQCFWVSAGNYGYPHKEVAQKFRDVGNRDNSLYHKGDTIALVSHIPLDYHIAGRVRGIHILESFTGELKGPDKFRFRLDKEGRIPFNTISHVVFGDSVLIKPMVTPKVRKALFEQAVKDRWLSREEEDIRTRIIKSTDLSATELRKYHFV